MRNIHYGHHSIGQPALRHAADDAHNLTWRFVEVGAESFAEHHTLPDGVLVWPILPGERFVDDHYMGRASRICPVEVATAKKRNTSALEITGGNKPPVLSPSHFSLIFGVRPSILNGMSMPTWSIGIETAQPATLNNWQGLMWSVARRTMFSLALCCRNGSRKSRPQSEHVGRIDSWPSGTQTGECANISSPGENTTRPISPSPTAPDPAVLESVPERPLDSFRTALTS